MNKPDLIVSWPDNCDYPLFRQYIRTNRARFNEVIIVFTKTNSGVDFTDFVRLATFEDRALCVESPTVDSGQDWRNIAVNAGLLHSLHSEFVLFTEQDFLPTDANKFWDTVEAAVDANSAKVVGVKDGDRLHPCFLMIDRKVLNETSKNFAANPPQYDHFGKIAIDLRSNRVDTFIIDDYWYHMAGLSHNWRLMAEGGEPNYKKDAFDRYLTRCLSVSVPLEPNWLVIATNYLGKQQ